MTDKEKKIIDLFMTNNKVGTRVPALIASGFQRGTLTTDAAYDLYTYAKIMRYPNYYQELEAIITVVIEEDGMEPSRAIEYASNGFSIPQMRAINKGYRSGLSPEQIYTFADYDLNPHQMNVIRDKLVNGGSIEEAEDMANAFISKNIAEDNAARDRIRDIINGMIFEED